MKILYVSQYYPPESNAPANRVSRLARAWASEGARVTVLTGFPNHPEGRVYPGYRASRPSEERDGDVRVVRAPIYAAANAGVMKRSLAYASFCTSASLLGPALLRERPDVVVATSPQLLVGAAGAWLGPVLRAPFVLEVRDLWPDSIVAVGAMKSDHPVVRGLHILEKTLYSRAKRIVVVTESFRDILSERGVSRDRIGFFPNGLDGDLFTPDASQDEPMWPGKKVIAFCGTVGMAHGLGTVLEAAKLVDEDTLFVVVGEGAERAQLEARAKELGVSERVLFTGRLPREKIPAILRRAELSLVMLKDSPLFKTVLPSKLFESMGCARPIVLGVDGEARALVERAECGVFFDPGSPAALANAVKNLLANPAKRKELGENGRRFVLEHFDREAIAKRYLTFLRETVRA